MTRVVCAAVVGGVCLVATAATAALVVVHEESGTIDAARYLGAKVSEAAGRRALAAAGRRLPTRVRPVAGYPVRPGVLSLGGGGRSVARPGVREAVFVLGAGHGEWLAREAARLQAAGAVVGYVVEARSRAAFENVRAVGEELGFVLVPAPGDGVAEMLGVVEFPVVVEPVR